MQLRYAHHRTQTHQNGDAAEILHRFEIESAVLGVDERPMEAGIPEDAYDVLRAQVAESASKLHFTFGQRLFYGVDSHGKCKF